MALGVLTVLFCAGPWSSRATAEPSVVPPTAAAVPVCRSGPRLRAVSYDPEHAERSFAVFGVGAEQRAQVFPRGARIGGYQIASIEPGSVVLSTRAERCSVRLRRAPVARRQATVSAALVRGELRARKAAFASAEAARQGAVIARNED